MSNTKNTGGAAFPAMGEHNTPTGTNYVWNEGMTLRDYFAAKAVAGIVSGKVNYDGMAGFSDDDAAQCYIIADAMIKAREQ